METNDGLGLAIEQIAVRAGALKTDVCIVVFQRVNENPIRVDMAVPTPYVAASQWMVQILRWQIMSCDEEFHGCFDPPRDFPCFPWRFTSFLN
jgi:hypothetical protein